MRVHRIWVVEGMFGVADRIVCATWDGVFGWDPGEGLGVDVEVVPV